MVQELSSLGLSVTRVPAERVHIDYGRASFAHGGVLRMDSRVQRYDVSVKLAELQKFARSLNPPNAPPRCARTSLVLVAAHFKELHVTVIALEVVRVLTVSRSLRSLFLWHPY